MVRLTANGITQEFTIEHAERLLSMPNNGGWKLNDKDYYLKGNVIFRTNRKINKAAEEAKADTESE